MIIQNTHIEINLKNLEHNLNFIRSKISEKTKILCVVKAFGYGSEPIEIAKRLEDNKVDYLAVAYSNEGIELRKSGITTPILVLHPQTDDFDEIIKYQLEPNIYSFRILESFLKKSGNLKEYPFHLKFNTGLNRLGFSFSDIEDIYRKISCLQTVKIKYIFSHLGASEDFNEKNFTQNQIKLFEKISKKMSTIFQMNFKKHLLNTSGVMNYRKFQYDMVRTGIGLYGYGNDDKYEKFFKPVLSLKSIISQIHEIKKGDSVGYNRGFIAAKDTRVGIIPIGHADGISRSFGNGRASFIINGMRAKIIGNVCMDMLMVDISRIQCAEGDEVIIIDSNSQNADQLAKQNSSISYEVLTSLSNRIKRIFIK